MKWEHFAAPVKEAGLQPADCGYHWRIKGGAVIVDVWPSKPFLLKAYDTEGPPQEGTLMEAIALAGKAQEPAINLALEDVVRDQVARLDTRIDCANNGTDAMAEECARLRKRLEAVEQAWQEHLEGEHRKRFPERPEVPIEYPAKPLLKKWCTARAGVLRASSAFWRYSVAETKDGLWRAAALERDQGVYSNLGHGELLLVLANCEAHEAAEREKSRGDRQDA